ncbi:MAG: glycosyltransferase [Tepidisphaeraceae bacterium]
MKPVNVVHIINSFEHGGAESMLCDLVTYADRQRFRTAVISLIDDLTVAGPVVRARVPMEIIGLRPPVPSPAAIARLWRCLHRHQPDVVHCWMDHSNLIGGLVARACTSAKIIWAVHHSQHDAGVAKLTTRRTGGAGARLCRHLADGIVYCSQASHDAYRRAGFSANRAKVIPNGFDVSRFRVDPSAPGWLRESLGLTPRTKLIGIAARFNPQKDFPTFFAAAGRLAQQREDVAFVVCGAGLDDGNAELSSLIRNHHLNGRVHLLGPRRDMPRIYAGLDVLTLSSITEAFPLVLGEAMACGTLCAATDVGDAALIIGDTGRIVPPRQPDLLAAAWHALLELPPEDRAAASTAARQRIAERFEIGAIARTYEDFYLEVLAASASTPFATASSATPPALRLRKDHSCNPNQSSFAS